MMLGYTMRREDKAHVVEMEDVFKGNLLVGNPALFDQLYGDGKYEQVEAETEFFHPSSEAELKALLADFNASRPEDWD
jgi:hypothetical protein